jgi:YjbE family integral membrane protein
MENFMELMNTPAFWLALGQIIWINIILSGDNAVVIALAARALPEKQQKQAILWGSAGAVILRIALTFIAAYLLQWSYVQIVGGLLLLWIGVQLMSEQDEGGEATSADQQISFTSALRTILIADLVMSLDNVIGVALAAKIDGVINYPLLVIGLAISIPLVIFGSNIMIKLMERFPIIITLGAALIGWVAGDAITHDPALKFVFEGNSLLAYVVKAACATLVIVVGKMIQTRAQEGHKNA